MSIHPRKVLEQLEVLSGPGSQKTKKEIIKENLSTPEFVQSVKYAYDPFMQFYTTTVPGLADVSSKARRDEKWSRKGMSDMFEDDNVKWTWQNQFNEMFILLDKLAARKLPPNSSEARNTILEWADHCDSGTIDVFRRILNKDMRVGMSEKTFNKVNPGWIRTFDVQLAHPFDEKKLKFPCFVDPKFDGERCLCHIDPDGKSVVYLSRNGKQFFNFGCFTDELCKVFHDMGPVVADAEVISKHGFQKLSRTPVYFDPAFDSTNLRLMVFDFLPQDAFDNHSFDMVQKQRYSELTKLFKSHNPDQVYLVDSRMVKDWQEAEEIFTYWVAQGLEGVILKQLDGKYEFKRSWDWIKLKPKKTAEFKIVGTKMGRDGKKFENMFGSLVVEVAHEDKESVLASVKSGFTDHMHQNIIETGDQILYTNPEGEVINLKGEMVEVTFDGYTEDGSLRFPRLKRRGDKIIRTDI